MGLKPGRVVVAKAACRGLTGDCCDEQETPHGQGSSNGLSQSAGDFHSQLAAINLISAAQPQAAANQGMGAPAGGGPAVSPPPNKGTQPQSAYIKLGATLYCDNERAL